MNERIRELAEQAGGVWRGGYVEQANGDSVYTDKKFVSGGDMDVEQFARLIVRECANFVENIFDDDGGHAPCEDYAKGIKKHFGVEE